MKHVRKIFAFALTLFMAFAIAGPALAEGEGYITVATPTDPAPTGNTTYTIYKVFDGKGNGSGAISYTLIKPLTAAMKNYFEVDTAGNVSVKASAVYPEGNEKAGQFIDEAGVTAAIRAYVNGDTPVDTVVVSAGQASNTSKNLGYGYFFIDTTTGTIAAVDSTNTQVTVNDKNTITKVDKTLANGQLEAIQQIGKDESFHAPITLGKGATNVKYDDTMVKMAYNEDLVVTINDDTTPVTPGVNTYTVTTKANKAGFEVVFSDNYTKNLAAGTVIHLNYSGKITAEAVQTDPATNTASVTSGENGSGAQTPSQPVKVYTATIAVEKSFENGSTETLKAGFVLKRHVVDDQGQATDAFEYYAHDTQTGYVTWVSNIDAAEEIETGTDGKLAFTGLDNGTYWLEEKTVPDGYNKALDVKVEINDLDPQQKTLVVTQPVENKLGTAMPSTGGIGTTIFYIVGGVMVAGAAIFLLTKRRVSNAE